MEDGLRQRLAGGEAGEILRTAGGLAVGVGAMVLFLRRATPDLFGSEWGAVPLLLVLLVPCIFLYGLGLLGRRLSDALRPWQAIYLTFGFLLVPAVLAQLVEVVGGDPGAPLNIAWTFLVAAAAAAAAGWWADLRFGLLAASLAVIVSWLALWDEILHEGLSGDFGTFRGLCVLIAIGLLAVAYTISQADRSPAGARRGGEILTGAGVAAVLGGAISLAAIGNLVPGLEFAAPETSLLWDTYLLAVSVALIGAGAWLGARGPAYLGALGLGVFAYVVGLDLDSDHPQGAVVGWPLLLLGLGVVAVLASLLGRSGLRGALGSLRGGRDPGGEAPAERTPPASSRP